jgi:hypothetical protein
MRMANAVLAATCPLATASGYLFLLPQGCIEGDPAYATLTGLEELRAGHFSPRVRCATLGFDIPPLRGEETVPVEGAGGVGG